MARGKRCGKRCRAGLHRTRRPGGRRRVPRTGGLLTAALLGLGGTLLGKALAKNNEITRPGERSDKIFFSTIEKSKPMAKGKKSGSKKAINGVPRKAVSGTNIDLRKLQHGKTYRIKVPKTQGLILDAIKGIGQGIGKLFGIG